MHRLLAIKQRSVDKGLILVASDFEQLRWLLKPLSVEQTRRVQSAWPGAVTFVIPCHEHVPAWLRGRFDSLAVRVSAHPVVHALCEASGGVLVSTSANVSGQPALRSSAAVNRRLGSAVDYVMPGAVGGRAAPSEIRDITNNKILRASA